MKYAEDIFGEPIITERVPRSKTAKIRTSLHYTEPDAREERSVFGQKSKDLFYNYDDRLWGDKWNEGLKIAKAKSSPATAEFYEIALRHFHDNPNLDLQHIVLGCNMSNGYSYLVFGYKLKEIA